MEDPQVRHDALLRPAETFRAIVDVDGNGYGAVLTAFNKASIIALLQTVMICYRQRVSGYVVRREGGELVASVNAREYVAGMAVATRLKDRPPEGAAPDAALPFAELTEVRPKMPTNDERARKNFTLEVVIDGIAETFPVTAPNADSMVALMTAATCEKMPRISGWNLYDDRGELLASVPAVAFLAKLAEATPLGKAPANVKAAPGWRATPVVTPTSDEWQRTMDQAKRDGRVPQ